MSLSERAGELRSLLLLLVSLGVLETCLLARRLELGAASVPTAVNVQT